MDSHVTSPIFILYTKIEQHACQFMDFILQDDPFSALDAHVGKHVFEEAILNRMLKKKRTVILSTHQLQYLSYASHVSRLDFQRLILR